MSGEASAHAWWVKTNDKVYGPYNRAQMDRFVSEGRVATTTLVAARATGEWTEARHCPPLQTALADARGAFRAANSEPRPDQGQANMLIWCDLIAGSSRRFEHELRQLGAVAEVVPGLYIVRTTRTAGTMRNVLSQVLERGDKLLVIDASRDRLAWFNLGPETDVHIREVWNADAAKAAEPA